MEFAFTDRDTVWLRDHPLLTAQFTNKTVQPCWKRTRPSSLKPTSRHYMMILLKGDVKYDLVLRSGECSG